ncbi:MAG: TRAP transporter small permease [Tropicimonas sp.]|uniref:TRAP transporter small permease n=1 Tax=Tropicimonas sp. TaxID=2067044 RepID=UPI003A87C0D2
MIGRIDSLLRRAVNGASALLLAAVVCLGIAQVASRYLLGSSIIWSEEAIRLLYVWMILIAAANADHMRITFLDTLLGQGARTVLQAFRVLVVLAMLALLIWGAWQLNLSFGRDRYVALGLSKSWYWMAGVTGCLLWAGTQVSGLLARPGEQEEGR